MNNSVLDGTVIEPDKLTLPFSEAYLKQRHFLYERADITSFDVSQQSELAYLKIQERYPERFLPWPAQTNILRNLTTKNASVEHWSTFVVQRLSDAKESKILLSRYERNTLSGYIEEASDEANELKAYLAQYKPRTRLGLYQHPNGKEWYQSKLNYYYGISKSPNETLNQIQKELASLGKKGSLALSVPDTNHFALSYLKVHCDLVQGLNWVDSYVNLPATAKQCIASHKSEITRLLLSLMEIDIGLHYQGWSEQQARVTLQARVRMTDFDANKFVAGTVLYPATVFSLMPFIVFNSL
ncbi:hypothetical protein PCIT_a3167 [Pseudoalteromonas citrea]|uniref:Uncharacterized protein n=2 Tax=Pseudoalteromonas citrea TaxID=43655 RepID=A0AAD4FRR5_9GAMM|nr:hypothetical protein [Pseudoalteromonas citrea]KAF7770183.1 hypothetical protein PCIT_a3167 [Pseudoalteromonas citrea]